MPARAGPLLLPALKQRQRSKVIRSGSMRVVLFCVAARFVYYSLLPSHAVGANSPPPFARPSREKTLFCDGCACACVSGASYITLCLLPRPRRPPCRSMPAEGGRENCARGSGPSGRAAASSPRRGYFLPCVCRVPRKSTIAAAHAFRLTASLRTALTPGGRAMSAVHTFAQVRVRGLVGACASLGRLGEGELAVEWLKGGGLARG